MAVMTSKFKHAEPQKIETRSTLLRRGPFDKKDDLESTLLESFTSSQMQLKAPYQLHSHSEADLVQLNQALVYGILTQPQSQQSYIMHLAVVTRDGYAGFVSILIRLVHECYLKLLDQPRRHLLWLVRELIRLAAAEVDNLCLSLLRHIVGGDVSHWNIWLAGQMLNVLGSNWSWLVKHSALLTGALFTFLRLLPDHFMSKSPIVNELKQDEVAFCVKILRNRFQDCLVIGRDLVRLLQDVACIPEFELIWSDLLSNPSAFNTVGFADIAQLYVVRTPTRYLMSRLTPEMEAQIRFILTHVRMGTQQRYQAWFAQRFLTTPGSETLVCDLIRFICCAHHPTNQILQSDVVPRWAVIGWLLKCCRSHHVEANAKLALFYDWLFFMTKTDNLMNIEPALLLMIHSIPKYIDITHSLLEFLFLCMEHYDPDRKDLISCGVTASVDILIEKGVAQSLRPLFSSPHVALSLRKRLKDYFPEYCHGSEKEAKGELSPKDVSKVCPVPVLGAQSPVSKKIEPPSTAELKHDAGESRPDKAIGSISVSQMGREHGDDSSGIIPGNKQNVDIEEEKFCASHETVTVPELVADTDSGDDTLETMPHKKRRIDVVTLDDLSRALQGSCEEAVDVFEGFLLSHLSDSVARDAESNLKKTPKHGVDYPEVLAKRVSSILKESKSGFCAPLHGYSPDSLEEDEILSVTSAVLRMYTQSIHPKLLQMLLTWHAEGFAIGARLLCYSCRLAENATRSNSEADSAHQSPQKHEEKLETLPGKMRKASKPFPFSWHQESCGAAIKKMGAHQKATELLGSAQVHGQPAVSMSFMAYRSFLKGLRNRGLHLLEDSPSNQPVYVSDKHEHDLIEGQRATELQPWFIKDLETCLAWSIPRLLSVLSSVFNYLPDLSKGNQQVIKLLVSTVDPVELSKLELKISLKELSIFGTSLVCIQSVIKSSLLWDCFEQQYLWRLLTAEWQNPSPIFLSEFLKCCALILKPGQHFEAVSGLLSFLRMHCPTTHIVSTLLLLPQGFNRLVAAVLATWMSIDTSRFLGCLTTLVAEKSQLKDEASKNFVQHLHSMDSSMGYPLSSSFLDNLLQISETCDEQTKVELMQIRSTILKLVERLNPNPTSGKGGVNTD